MSDWSYVEDDVLLAKALRLARGSYQAAIICGTEAVSTSTLRGKARSYSGRYKASIASLLYRLRRLETEGVLVYVERQGKRDVLVIRYLTEQDLVDRAEQRMA